MQLSNLVIHSRNIVRNYKYLNRMALIPHLLRDWLDDYDRARPSRLIDQNFGLGLARDDLLGAISNYRPLSSALCPGYYRPWGTITRQDRGISNINADSEKVQVILDVQQFSPEEITVKTVDDTVVVEGKHEEKEDQHGYISRHFVRRYVLPKDVELSNISSSLSSDGVLTITAPKKAVTENGETAIPIVQTGVPAAKTVT